MALNKSQTSTVAKIIIGLFGLILVVGLAGPSISALLASLGDGGDAGGAGGGGTLDQATAEFQPVVDSWQSILASDPTSTTALVALGNTYFDWALRLQQATDVPGGADQPYWAFAVDYYDQAIANGVDEPGVRVDAAISDYYAGNTPGAIARIESVMTDAPDFPPAWFNGGIFYQDAGRSAEALAAFRRYLELDPQGQFGNVEYAREQIAALEQAVPDGATEVTPTP